MPAWVSSDTSPASQLWGDELQAGWLGSSPPALPRLLQLLTQVVPFHGLRASVVSDGAPEFSAGLNPSPLGR